MSISKILSSLIFALVLAGLFSFAAAPQATSAATPDKECRAAGGKWSGPNSGTGTCIYGERDKITQRECSATAVYQEKYEAGLLVTAKCLITTDDKAAGPITLKLGNGKNGQITFAAGACASACVITSTLPRLARKALLEGSLATLYVRQVSAQTSYVFCFKNPRNQLLAVYKLVDDGWKLIVRSTGNPLCAFGSGTGVYYLGK